MRSIGDELLSRVRTEWSLGEAFTVRLQFAGLAPLESSAALALGILIGRVASVRGFRGCGFLVVSPTVAMQMRRITVESGVAESSWITDDPEKLDAYLEAMRAPRGSPS